MMYEGFVLAREKNTGMIDGIINSAATESHDVRSTDRYRLGVDKSLAVRWSVKY
jgi:hypothetical protein